jgi:osmotically-inducible protein OsmY
MKVKTALLCAYLLVSGTNVVLAAGPKADNTAQNKGATEKNAVTAEKQKSGKDQVTVLAEIRKSIVAESGLSMDAKNVKILYSKGHVTLRGPVDSADEKATVERLAKQCDAVSSVKNLLTVANKPH